MGRTMQISKPERGSGRKHVIGTSMSSKKRAVGKRAILSQEDYSIFSPVLCPAVVSWVKEPDSAGQSVEDIVLSYPTKPTTKGVMSDRSLPAYQDAVADFQESDSPALWKEIHTDISTDHPEFEQMHPLQPNVFLERNKNPSGGSGLLTPDKTSPDMSGHLDLSVDSSTNASVRAAMKSPRSKYVVSSSSPDEFYARERATVTSSPQHSSMWSSPHHPTPSSNPAPAGIPAPKSNFGWLTPTRALTRTSDPRSPEFAKPPLPHPRVMSPSHMAPPAAEPWSSPPKSNAAASTMKLKRQAKLQQQQEKSQLHKESSSPSDISVASNTSNVTIEKPEKPPGKGWKNLPRSISPIFAGKKSETLREVAREQSNGSFLGDSKRRPVSNGPANSAPVASWSNGPALSAPVAGWSRAGSGDGPIVTPDSDTSGDVTYPPEPNRAGSINVKTKSYSRFSFLGWGRKKGNSSKVNELFQNADQVAVKGKLDSNSFKVMDYTIKTLQFKLEQAKKNELATVNEFEALQIAVDAAEEKCKQLEQRCQDLETELGQLQAETKEVELDYEIAKHRRENTGNGLSKAGRGFSTLDVTPQLFQKAFEESKLSIKKLASALCTHIREAGESATQVITSLLEQQKDVSDWVSKMPRNVIILFFESFLNQVLFESFENVTFEPNGSSPICDPDALKSACCKAFLELRKQEWAAIEKSLGKPGSTIVNATFHRFFVIRMELILSQLTKVADKETSLSLLASFFNAFKSVWLLHHLAFAHEVPVTIFRVSLAADFDPRFMEQVTTAEEDATRSKISVMVNPGFIVSKPSGAQGLQS